MNLEIERLCRRKQNTEAWVRYQELMRTRPELFAQNQMLQIVTDLKRICQYELEHNCEIGVRYCNEPFSIMVVDLVQDSNGNYFAYERHLPYIQRGAVVCVTMYGERFVLLRQFRHAIRDYQLSFPRGYGEAGLTPEQNVEKEIKEELSASVFSCRKLGEVVADSGLSGTKVCVYLCEVSKPMLRDGYEGIEQICYYTSEELGAQISSGRISDSFTLSALKLMDHCAATQEQ